jgi:Peptidase family S41
MFYEKAFVAAAVSPGGYWSTAGRMRYIYPGANTTYEFANGTIITVPNIAIVKGDFDGVVDGKTFYETFCAGSTASANAQSMVAADITAAGYPHPVVITNDAIVSCYYLDGAGFEDVAVLSILAFESESPPEFQAVVQTCIADAKAAGKTKMVIDVQANGGGYILQGYDTFRQFFPSIVQDGFSRLRENETFTTMAKLFSDSIPANYNPLTAPFDTINAYESFLNYRFDLNLTDQNFSTFEDKFGPHYYKGDPYTSILRWNLSDPLLTINSTFGIGMDITGYGRRTGFTQPFAAENIIMLYDGYCASTCTLFSEMMRIQGGVKSVMFGGRPGNSPIQALGGVKGAQSFGFADVLSLAQYANMTATPEEQAILAQFTDYPISRSSSNGLNLRDQILRGNVDDGLPAQYVVEEADCRLFWTKPMINDVREVWKAAAKAAWGGGGCVAGSLSKRDASTSTGIEELTARSTREVAQPWKGVTKRFNVRRDFKSDKTSLWAAKHILKVIA